MNQAVDAQRLIDIRADAASQVASDTGTAGLGNQDLVLTQTSATGSGTEDILCPGAEPEENEELMKADSEFTQCFGIDLPPLDEAVNVTQGYFMFFKACAEGSGFQLAREKEALRVMLQRSVIGWLVGKNLASPLALPHECLRTYLRN